MRWVVQLLVSSLVTGSVLALIAFGYNLVYSTTRIINFAQGGTVVVAGYLTWWFTTKYPNAVFFRGTFIELTPIKWASILVILLSALVGLAVWLIAVVPLGRFDPTTNVGWILTTFSCFVIAQVLVGRFISIETKALEPWGKTIFGVKPPDQIAGVAFGPARTYLILGTIILMVLLEIGYTKTIIGRAFRAVAEDRIAAQLMGINVNFIIAASFALAGILAAAGSVLVAPIQQVNFINALLLGIEGFIAAVMGGLGSTRGAILGGYAIGFLKALLISITSSAARYENLTVFALFIAVLLVKPTGFFGEPVVEKV